MPAGVSPVPIKKPKAILPLPRSLRYWANVGERSTVVGMPKESISLLISEEASTQSLNPFTVVSVTVKGLPFGMVHAPPDFLKPAERRRAVAALGLGR